MQSYDIAWPMLIFLLTILTRRTSALLTLRDEGNLISKPPRNVHNICMDFKDLAEVNTRTNDGEKDTRRGT